jgi:hypothetical protein
MSEERPLSREDFRRLLSHSPSAECDQLCRKWKSLTDEWSEAHQAGDEDEMFDLELLINAVTTRMQWLNCPDCPPEQ